MMVSLRNLLTLTAAALALAACAGNSDRFARRAGPDEFVVARQAPLVVPPDFALRPPKPGAPRAFGTDAQQQAIEALFGPGVAKTPGETTLLKAATATGGDPTARSTVGDPATVVVDKGAQAKSIIEAPASNSDTATVTPKN